MLLKERVVLERKVEAFLFLSKYHHQLHIMIGEEEGDMQNAFQEFSNAIRKFDNDELIPVINAISRIQSVDPESENVKRLDYLVDYYQSGLSLQIEAIMRSYGYFESFSFESAIDIYDRIYNNL
tara:strand:- start:2498 stop:2869 length:372 start_codon:yes stop_codon:yes gene_type:complete